MSLRRISRPYAVSLIIAAALIVGLASNAFAASAGMPWEGPLDKLVTSLTGPVAKGIGIAAIVVAALGMAMGEGGSGMKSMLRIVFALAIVFTAGTFAVSFLGFSGGLAL